MKTLQQVLFMFLLLLSILVPATFPLALKLQFCTHDGSHLLQNTSIPWNIENNNNNHFDIHLLDKQNCKCLFETVGCFTNVSHSTRQVMDGSSLQNTLFYVFSNTQNVKCVRNREIKYVIVYIVCDSCRGSSKNTNILI